MILQYYKSFFYDKKILNSGFSLVEIVIALFFLSLLTLAISKMHYLVINSEKKTANSFIALNLANNKIEELLITEKPQDGSSKQGKFCIEWKIEKETNQDSIILKVKWYEAGIEKSLIIMR